MPLFLNTALGAVNEHGDDKDDVSGRFIFWKHGSWTDKTESDDCSVCLCFKQHGLWLKSDDNFGADVGSEFESISGVVSLTDSWIWLGIIDVGSNWVDKFGPEVRLVNLLNELDIVTSDDTDGDDGVWLGASVDIGAVCTVLVESEFGDDKGSW